MFTRLLLSVLVFVADTVLTISSGFNPTGPQPFHARFANGADLQTTFERN